MTSKTFRALSAAAALDQLTFPPIEKVDKQYKKEKAAKKKCISELQSLAEAIVPEELRQGLMIDVKEVTCGDQDCAPVDTLFTLIWLGSGAVDNETGGGGGVGQGFFSVPLAPAEIEEYDLVENFPDDETLTDWFHGRNTPWPRRPTLRFDLGTRVECRIGPDMKNGWAPGRVIKHFYSEPSWDEMVAPYQILLHDGRLIFAPADSDSVIRLRPKRRDPKSGSGAISDIDEDDDDGYDDSPPSPPFYMPPDAGDDDRMVGNGRTGRRAFDNEIKGGADDDDDGESGYFRENRTAAGAAAGLGDDEDDDGVVMTCDD